MAPTLIDDLVVVMEALLLAGPIHNETAGNAVDDLVGANVFINDTPNAFDPESDVGLRIHGGGVRDPNAPWFEGRYSIDCFGGTEQPVDSYNLKRTVMDRLGGANTITTASGCILESVQLGDAVLMDDPEQEGIFVVLPMFMKIRD